MISNVHMALGQQQQAMVANEQALAIAQEIDDPTRANRALTSLGDEHMAFGQHQQALEAYQQALIVAQESDNPSEASLTLVKIGNA